MSVENCIRVAYVDDETYMHEPFKMFMESLADISVDTFSGPGEVLGRLKECCYDAVISDYQMPDMDGLSFLREVRRTGMDIPFILFTGKGREEVAIEAINNGADYYVQKGLDPHSQFAELIHAVNLSVSERREREELRVTKQRLESILDNMNDAVVLFDLKYRVLYTNPSFQRILGWERDDLIRMRLPWVPEDDMNSAEAKISELVRSGKALHYEGKRRCRNGELADFQISIAPITDPDGRINSVSSILRKKEL